MRSAPCSSSTLDLHLAHLRRRWQCTRTSSWLCHVDIGKWRFTLHLSAFLALLTINLRTAFTSLKQSHIYTIKRMAPFPPLTGAFAAEVSKLGIDLGKPVGLKPDNTDCVCGRGGESNHHEVNLPFSVVKIHHMNGRESQCRL